MKEALASKPKEHWDKALAKRRCTCQKLHGVENVSQLPEVKKKVSDAWEVKDKDEIQKIVAQRKKTKLERYGDENFQNSEKASQTMRSFSKSKRLCIIKKRKQTNLKIYGVEHAWHQDCVKKDMQRKRCEKRYFGLFLKDEHASPMFSIDDLVKDPHRRFVWRCKHCGCQFESGAFEHQPYLARCLKCFPLSSSHSLGEDEIAKFLEQYLEPGEAIVKNTRKIISPRELDIFIESRKLAIEYNGIWWHSLENGTPIDYHQKKYLDCLKAGVDLVHVFDWHWKNRSEIVKMKLLEELGCIKHEVCGLKIAEDICEQKLSYFVQKHSLEDVSSFDFSKCLAFTSGENDELELVFIKSKFETKTQNFKLVKSFGLSLDKDSSTFVKKFLTRSSVEISASWPNERKFLEKCIGLQFNSTSAPRLWSFNTDSGLCLSQKTRRTTLADAGILTFKQFQ